VHAALPEESIENGMEWFGKPRLRRKSVCTEKREVAWIKGRGIFKNQ